MIIDCISDLHGHYPELEGGDLLIVAGDLTARDTLDEHIEFASWLSKQQYKKTIVIAGNHDNRLQDDGKEIKLAFSEWNSNTGAVRSYATYLCDSGTEFTYYDDRFPKENEGFLPSGERTIKIWGSPWTKTFPGMNPHCKAFTVDTEEELAEKFAVIPHDIDILVTHGPPLGIFDTVRRHPNDTPESTGSKYLSDKFRGSTTLKLHVFGHIHEHGGKSGNIGTTRFVNASHVNERYEPVNKPIRVIL